MMKIKISILAILVLSACHLQREDCHLQTSEDVNLWPVNASFELPPYRITDSLKFGKESILSYNITSLDSLIAVTAFVFQKKKTGPLIGDIDQQMLFQKKEVEYERKTKKLNETIINIGAIKVGYLKYLIEQKDKKFYEGRIFFYTKKKLAEVWVFEKYTNDRQNAHSIVDCIIKSLKLN